MNRTLDEVLAGLDLVRRSPRDGGTIDLIVRRPAEGERVVCEEAELDPEEGIVGDNWKMRGSSRTPDGRPHPDMQLALMNSRLIALVAGARDRWPLAGDQLYVDLDLSEDALAPGTELRIGSALIVITEQPHTGCRKFVDRFGADAMKVVGSPEGRRLRLRGAYARVIRGGTVRQGDIVRRSDH